MTKIKFVGRENDLINLQEKLQTTEQPLAITAVAGMSGMGKTELANQYAHQHFNDYPGGICWLLGQMGEGKISLLTELSFFVKNKFNLILPDDLGNEEKIVEYCWNHWLSEGNVLVILDDVKNYEEIERFLPRNKRFKILLTTQIDFSSNSDVETYHLEKLSREKSLELLESFVGQERLETNREIFTQLCEFLGDLPLGLVLAGQYLKELPKLPVATYWENIQAKKIAHDSLNPGKNVSRNEQTRRSVRAAFQLTWERIGEIDANNTVNETNNTVIEKNWLTKVSELMQMEWSQAISTLIGRKNKQNQLVFKPLIKSQELAAYFSLYALAPIPWEINGEEENAEEQERALQTLRQWHILEERSENIYEIHALMRHFLQEKLTDLDKAQELKRQFVGLMLNVAIEIDYTLTNEIIAKVSPYIDHITEVAKNYQDYLPVDFRDSLITPYVRLGSFYEDQSFYETAEFWLKQGLSLAEANFPDDHADIATCCNNLAGLYRSQGRYEEAEPLYLRALKIDEKSLPPDHPSLATHLNNLAGLYRSQGRYEEAEPLYLRAIKIDEKSLPPDHPSLATHLNNLAELYRSQGRYEEAEPLYLRAIKIDEKSLPPDHPLLATHLNNLANLYYSQGRYEEAEPLYLRAIKIFEKSLPPDHPDLASSLNNLANLYESQGRYEDAEPLYLRALKIDEKSLPPDHPSLATHLNNLAGLYRSQGRYEEAEPLYLRAIKIDEKSLPPDHPDLASSLNNLANLYESQGRYEDAEPLYLRALKIDEKSLPPDHPSLATHLNNLAGLYRSQGRYEEAEPLYLRAIKIDEKSLPPDHPSLATHLNNLANLYESQGRYEEAEPLYLRAIKIAIKSLGENHPNTQTIQQNYRNMLDKT